MRSQGDCPADSHPYAFGTCIKVYSDDELTFSNANTRCTDLFNEGRLVLVNDSSELFTLRGYVRAFGALDSVDMYSVGYMYNAGGMLEDVNGQSASNSVTDNIVDNGRTEDSSTCIALHVNATFIKVPCADILPFVCHYTLTGTVINEEQF